MKTSLETFFGAMGPFLEGRASVADVAKKLGQSPSGERRLALYPELIRRQKRGVLDHFFASARAACDGHEARLWERLAEQYIYEVSPTHWEPNRYAKPMLAFLETRQAAESSIPPVVVELADFAWVRFAAMVAEHPTNADLGMDRALFVRHYAHEVANYTSAVENGTSAKGAFPEATPSTLVVCRSRRTHRLEIVRPSLGALVALRRREVPDEPVRLPKGLTEADVDHEDATLVELGVVAAWDKSGFRTIAP